MAQKNLESKETNSGLPSKREDKFKTHRLIQIDKWIRSGEYPSVEKLQERYGVSRRTILRDIEFLRDRYDAPVEYDKIHKGYYYTDPTFLIQNVLLTEGDLFTVSTVMPLLEQYKNTPLEDSFRNIMSKIAEMLPNQVLVDSSFLNRDISFISDPLPKISQEVFYAVFRAVKSFEEITFEYKSVGSAQYKIKVLDCYHIVCQKGNWYVLGFDQTVGEIRIYALSRIRCVNFNGSRFTVPSDFDLSRHIDLSFGVWNNPEPPVTYELLFNASLANYITEREWHKDQTITTHKDGSVTLKFKSNQHQIVFSWVLSFGTSVKVITPESLASQIRQEAKNLAGMY